MKLDWTDFCRGFNWALLRAGQALPDDPFLLSVSLNREPHATAGMKGLVSEMRQHCDTGEMTLHRQITTGINEPIRWHEIGRAWSWAKDGAYPYASMHFGLDRATVRLVHITALVRLADVNMASTLLRALEAGPRLREIRVRPGTVLDILKVEWRYGATHDVALGTNPWRPLDRHPSEAQVT